MAVRGFRDIGSRAQNRMFRDRFSDQRSCGLRRHLDSVPPDTPIREIVDRCRVWDSHSEQKRGSSPGTDMGREHTGVSSDSTLVMKDSPRVEPQIPVSMASVVQSDLVGAQEVVYVIGPFESSEMGDSMDGDLLPELSGNCFPHVPLLRVLVSSRRVSFASKVTVLGTMLESSADREPPSLCPPVLPEPVPVDLLDIQIHEPVYTLFPEEDPMDTSTVVSKPDFPLLPAHRVSIDSSGRNPLGDRVAPLQRLT